MKKVLAISLVTLSFYAGQAFAGDDYDHKHEKNLGEKQPEGKKTEYAHDHNGDEKSHHNELDEGEHKAEKHEHKEGAKHEHEEAGEEGPKNVGPNKGITSYDEEKGFTLSEEAKKNFSLETQVLRGLGPWRVPASALLLTGEEKNVYRLRDGAFKRIDIKVGKNEAGQVAVNSEDLRNGDSVIIRGVGFIRIAEVDVVSGESGHHH